MTQRGATLVLVLLLTGYAVVGCGSSDQAQDVSGDQRVTSAATTEPSADRHPNRHDPVSRIKRTTRPRGKPTQCIPPGRFQASETQYACAGHSTRSKRKRSTP
jgi:hypothetical protein